MGRWGSWVRIPPLRPPFSASAPLLLSRTRARPGRDPVPAVGERASPVPADLVLRNGTIRRGRGARPLHRPRRPGRAGLRDGRRARDGGPPGSRHPGDRSRRPPHGSRAERRPSPPPAATLAMLAVDVRPEVASALDALLGRIAAAAAGRPPGSWIVARGYDHFALDVRRHPTADELERAARGRPCVLARVSGHLRAAAARPSRRPASTIRPNRRPAASSRSATAASPGFSLSMTVPPSSGLCRLRATPNSWTPSSAPAGCPSAPTSACRARRRDSSRTAGGLVTGAGDAMLGIGPVEIFTDGSVGSRTAAMSEPRLGELAGVVILCLPDEDLRALVASYHVRGYRLAPRAIGDRPGPRCPRAGVRGSAGARAAAPDRALRLRPRRPARLDARSRRRALAPARLRPRLRGSLPRGSGRSAGRPPLSAPHLARAGLPAGGRDRCAGLYGRSPAQTARHAHPTDPKQQRPRTGGAGRERGRAVLLHRGRRLPRGCRGRRGAAASRSAPTNSWKHAAISRSAAGRCSSTAVAEPGRPAEPNPPAAPAVPRGPLCLEPRA